MKKVEFSLQPTTPGTWILYVDMDNTHFSAKCTNKALVDLIHSPDEETATEAKINASELVLSKYGYAGHVTAEVGHKGTALYYSEEE